MSEGTGSPFPHDPPASLDPTGPSFSFVTDEWADPPPIVTDISNEHELTCIRNANDDIYCKLSNPTNWNRYIHLGYYAIMEGSMFDLEWHLMSANPIKMHRIIWYNFLFHADRDMDIPPLLNEWATKISQPYLKIHDPESLEMNTIHNRWKDLTFNEPMESEDQPWTEVRKTTKHCNSPNRTNKLLTTSKIEVKITDNTPIPNTSTPTATGSKSVPSATEELLDARNAQYEKTNNKNKSKKKSPSLSGKSKPVNNAFSNWLKSANISGDSKAWSTNKDLEIPKTPPRQQFDNTSEADTKQSAVQASTVATNDGTHRLTFRWSLTKMCYQDFESNEQNMMSTIHQMIQDIFSNQDGYLYHWTGAETPLATDQIDLPTTVREYISPHITMIQSTHQIIFGVRFCFNQNPIAWTANTSVTLAMKKYHVQVSVSNSTCDSGKLIIAGYLLLKAPNTTHRHRYLQYLRSILPDTAPYFDILRLRKTPMHQDILHLGIQCGEKHLPSLCQVLSQLLTGKGTALFLPRHIFGVMPEAQIRRHFEFHDTYVKSLRSLPLSPFVSNLDRVRTEHHRDGSTIERSTRQWAASLQTMNGSTSALCDVVNGGPDRKAYLLVPNHYYSDIQQQYREYKLSLHPIGQREARFRHNIPGLPEVIHITPTMQSNLDFLNELSDAEVWSQAEPSVKSPTDIPGVPPMEHQKSPTMAGFHANWPTPSSQKAFQGHSTTQPKLPTQQDSQRHYRANPQSTTSLNNTLASDTHSAITTPSMTKASLASTTTAKFHELEAMIQRQQKTIDNSGIHSKERLATIERQLHRFNDMDDKLEDITTGLTKYAESQTVLTQMVQADNKQNSHRFNELSNQIMSSMRSQNELSTSVVDIREHLDQVTAFMHNLSLKLQLDKPNSTLTATSHEGTDTLNTPLQHNDPGKPNPRDDGHPSPVHKSPMKKKQRSTPMSALSNSIHMDLLDSEESDTSNVPDTSRANLNRKFKRLTRVAGKLKLSKRRNSTISKIKKMAANNLQKPAPLDAQYTDDSDPGSANAS